MIVGNLLKFSFIQNFRNNIVSRIQSKFFGPAKFCVMETREIISFLPRNISYYWIKFFITNHISNHNIKTINLLWFLFVSYSSILLEIPSILFEYFMKDLESLKCFKPDFLVFYLKIDIFFIRIFTFYRYLVVDLLD